MCRYGFHRYKSHYACFDCRKVFRIADPIEWADQDVRAEWQAYERAFNRGAKLRRYPLAAPPERPRVKCPDCDQRMIDVGLDFKAPKRGDLKQWKKAERLVRAGVTFHSCGCGGPGPRPQRLSEVDEFLKRSRRCSPGEELLTRFARG